MSVFWLFRRAHPDLKDPHAPGWADIPGGYSQEKWDQVIPINYGLLRINLSWASIMATRLQSMFEVCICKLCDREICFVQQGEKCPSQQGMGGGNGGIAGYATGYP